jgi:hypothetical protein
MTKRRFQIAMRALCGLSFLYMLGLAGNSDLGLEPSTAVLFVKLSVGVAIFGLSAWLGGLMK